MKKMFLTYGRLTVVAAVLLLLFGAHAQAAINGITGTAFNLTAKEGHISTPDGNSILMWGYANADGTGLMQYPGPTLIVNQGQTITVNLTNELPPGNPVSILFPGQDVTATGGSAGLLTRESTSSVDTVTYTFTANNPGTFIYQSGTRPELQLEMGLVGTLIVRPTGFNATTNKIAYDHPETAYDWEYLFLLTEIDPTIHEMVEFGMMAEIDNTKYFPVYWLINGRCAPDTLLPDNTPWLPHQPYASLPRMNPGGKVLMRIVGASRDQHPFHHHGNDSFIIGRQGRMLSSAPGAGPDLAQPVFTISPTPGETVDAIFEWTGEKLGFDIYGDPNDPAFAHVCVDNADNETGAGTPDGFDDATYEYCPDHGKPFPVILPEKQDLTFGGFWSGGPFMGTAEALPPGEGGLNPNAAFTFVWHSHNEKELTNFDVFIGGMLTLMFIEPPHVVIP